MKQRKTVAKAVTPRFKFVTHDGIVVMDRPVEDWVFDEHPSVTPNFIDVLVAAEARRKGVKILRTDVVQKVSITSTVEWLSKNPR